MSENSPPPDLAQMAALLAAMRPTSPDTQSLPRIFQGMIVVIALAVAFWVVTSINTMQQTLVGVSMTVKAIQDSVGSVQSAQTGSANQIGDLRASSAQIAVRVSALETAVLRNADRLRVLEGQKPIDEKSAP
jgi:hypothetical protein